MGQSGEQAQLIEVLQSSLQVLAKERCWSSALVASDNFFAWVDGEPCVQVSPDVYVLDGAYPFEGLLPKRWEAWRPEHRPPRFVVEIVSSEWKKDYEINPARYDHLGVGELVLADQEAVTRDLSAKGRAPLLVYRRSEEDRLELVYRGQGPAFCAEIDAYLCFQDSPPGGPRVRISRDPEGTDIVATFREQVAAAEEQIAVAEEETAAAKEEAAAAKEETVAAKEETAAAKEAAEAAKEETVAAKEETAAAKEEIAAAKEETAAAKEETAAAKEETAAAKEETAAVREEIAAAQVKLADQAAEIAALQARLRARKGS